MTLLISTLLVQNAIQFCMSGQLTGWAGIGFGPVHQAMNSYVGWVTSSGYAVLQEGYSNSFDIPMTNTQNSAQIISYSQTLTNFRMCFRRPLSAGGLEFVSGSNVNVYWAYHMNVNPESVSANIRYAQHTHTGSRMITLPSNPRPTVSPTSINPSPTVSPTASNPDPTASTPDPTPTASTPDPTPTALIPDSTSTTSFLQPDDRFYVSWSIKDSKIQFNYDCQIDGWVGIGFDLNRKIHGSTDMYISWILSSGTGVIQDGYSTSETQPEVDPKQSAVVLNVSRIQNRFKFSFERLLDTGDSMDVPLYDWLLMGWAYHPTSNPNTPNITMANIPIHTQRGSVWINLYTGELKEYSIIMPSVYYLITVLILFLFFSVFRIRKRLKQSRFDGFYKGSQFEPYIHTRLWLGSRIPLLDISRIDMFIGILILALNIGSIFIGTRMGLSQSKIWGDLCAANSLLVAIPVTRNSIITWVTKVPFEQTIMYHRWLGRITIIQGVVHFACSIDQTHFSWTLNNYYGFISMVCLAIIAFTSIENIRRKMFNLFFYSHHVLFVYYVFGSLHSDSFFRYSCIAASIYGLDRFIRLLRGIYPRKVIYAEKLSDRILKVRFPKNKYFSSQRIAQYAFLNFPKTNLLEWHPFTLVNGPDDPFHEVYIKSLGDYTSDIVEHVSTDDWVRMDGPYGYWSFEHKKYSHILFVCGGIGITPCISFIRHVYSSPEYSKEFNHIRHIYLVWCSSSEKEAKWVNEELLRVIELSQRSDYPNFYLYVFITGQSYVKNPTYFIGRPDMNKVFDTAETRMLDESQACVFVCGPKSLSQQVWDTWSHRTTGKKYDFRQEIFEF